MDYYSKLASGYDELHGQEQLAKLRIIFSHVTFSGKVLDVGAGTCLVAKHLGKKVTIISVDPSKKMLDQGIGERHVAKAEQLPFPDKIFDGVISLTALHHCDLIKALAEIRRVAKPGAVVALSFLKKSPRQPLFIKLFPTFFHKIKTVDLGQDRLYIGTLTS